ncbi:MAG: Gfo/Idh/MocA family protein [Planctomycetota bacterium]|jgi:threonine dehydrogenase-like Zn-dependent dehydrogenase
MRQINRRGFLLKSGAGLAGLALAPAISQRRVLGANEHVNVALIGYGGRGRMVLRNMIEQGAEATYICDLHPERLDRGVEEALQAQSRRPKATRDTRALLDSKDVDAVVIATPDHWHAPATILACQAGKDVYVEKPHSHTIWGTRRMIEAARKYKRIVQVGTQSRSAPYTIAGREPAAPVEVGHRSATVCHLGNIAMMLKRELQWDPDDERFVNDEEANRMLDKPRRAPWHI